MTPSEIRLLALSLYASSRKVERLPRYTEHDPRTIVEIVAVPSHLWNTHDAEMDENETLRVEDHS